MSLNEIAADLTCEAEEFEPATTPPIEPDSDAHVLGQFSFPAIPSIRLAQDSSTSSPRYHVHSGMLRLARAMGEVGKPVQVTVHEALHNNPGYGAVYYDRTRPTWMALH